MGEDLGYPGEEMRLTPGIGLPQAWLLVDPGW